MKARVAAILFAFLFLAPPLTAQERTDDTCQTLLLRRKRLKQVPSEVWQRPGLTVLDLSKNPLTELPDSIARLELTQLLLQRTYITEFPSSVAHSPLAASLRLLDMRGCRLTEGQQEAIRELLPDTKILWDMPCECGAD